VINVSLWRVTFVCMSDVHHMSKETCVTCQKRCVSRLLCDIRLFVTCDNCVYVCIHTHAHLQPTPFVQISCVHSTHTRHTHYICTHSYTCAHAQTRTPSLTHTTHTHAHSSQSMCAGVFVCARVWRSTLHVGMSYVMSCHVGMSYVMYVMWVCPAYVMSCHVGMSYVMSCHVGMSCVMYVMWVCRVSYVGMSYIYIYTFTSAGHCTRVGANRGGWRHTCTHTYECITCQSVYVNRFIYISYMNTYTHLYLQDIAPELVQIESVEDVLAPDLPTNGAYIYTNYAHAYTPTPTPANTHTHQHKYTQIQTNTLKSFWLPISPQILSISFSLSLSLSFSLIIYIPNKWCVYLYTHPLLGVYNFFLGVHTPFIVWISLQGGEDL